MKKNLSKPLSIVAGGIIVSALLTSCTATTKDTGAFVSEIEPSIVTEQFVDTSSFIDEAVYEKNYKEEFIDFLEGFDVSKLDIESILTNPEEYPKEVQAAAAYHNLKNFGYSINDVKDELHNIVVYAQVPRCMSDNEFEFLVGKLAKTLNYFSNPFSSYAALARCIHELDCPLEHGLNEYGAYTCDNIASEYKELTKTISLESYILGLLPNDIELMELFSRIPDTSDGVLSELINECELIISLGLMPATDLDEDSWYRSFGLLLSTLGEEDSLFEKYNGLALRLHNALFPNDIIEASDEINYYVRKMGA